MRNIRRYEPLTDAELDRLGEFLEACKSGKAMNLEELDGFFAALISGPQAVMPSEYNREVFGGDLSEAVEFANLDEAKEILGLLMRHRNTIAGTPVKGGTSHTALTRRRDRRRAWQRLDTRLHARHAHAARWMG
jgi:yecA family protein